MSNFESALAYVLNDEGAYSDNAKDKGGATNFGITLGFLNWITGKPSDIEDVKNLTREKASAIYRILWDKYQMDLIHDVNVASAIFDMLINIGAIAIKEAQEISNAPDVDCRMGPMTANAINAMKPAEFLLRFSAMRVTGYVNSSINKNEFTFLRGWINRALRIQSLVEKMV